MSVAATNASTTPLAPMVCPMLSTTINSLSGQRWWSCHTVPSRFPSRTALDEGAGDPLQQGHVADHDAFVVSFPQEVVVAEVVRDRPREAHAELRVLIALPTAAAPERSPSPSRSRPAPPAPAPRGGAIRAAGCTRRRGSRPAPPRAVRRGTARRPREEPSKPPGQQGHFGVRAGAHRGQHQLGDGVRVRLRIPQPQHRTPRHAPHQPPPDAQVPSQQLQVADQMRRRVDGHVRPVSGGVRRGASAATLVEQHDPILGGVAGAPEPRA